LKTYPFLRTIQNTHEHSRTVKQKGAKTMANSIKANGKSKRGKRGLGRLYKKLHGKEYPADSPVNAAYWIAYTVNSKRFRQALHDERGKPITDRKKAETERLRIIAPFLAKDETETQRQLVARYQSAEARQEAAVSAAQALIIENAPQAYLNHPGRPDSGIRTSKGYISQLERFTRWMADSYPETIYMRDISPDTVREYVKDLEKEQASPSTFNQHIRTLTRVWTVLQDEIRGHGNLWDTPKRGGMVARKSTTGQKIERRKRALTLDEVNAIIDKAKGELRDMLILVACTGQRLVDIVKLQWKSIDLGAGVIELYPQKTRRRKAEPVFIPILPHARNTLEANTRRKGYVFRDLVNEYEKDNGSTLTKQIQRTIKAAGIDTHKEGTGFEIVTDESGKQHKQYTGTRAVVEIGAHSLRHTFNTLARASGIPDAMVKKITGHTTDAMTDHYTQFDKALVAKLSQSFAALPSISSEKLTLPEKTTKDEQREPLPDWAVELIGMMNSSNWNAMKDELLKGDPTDEA